MTGKIVQMKIVDEGTNLNVAVAMCELTDVRMCE